MITYASSLENFTGQFDYVLSNYAPHGFKKEDIQHIVLGGLGGSGITALTAKSWFYSKSPLPIETVNDYTLPSYVNSGTLVILNSYSGNTEETVEMYEQAKAAGAGIITIASGGKLMELAKADNVYFLSLPEGYQPRMTFGMGLGYLMLILGELLGEDTRAELEKVKERFSEEQEKQKESAAQIFHFFKNSLKQKFIIPADRKYFPLAVRFAQQINENAKLEAFVHQIPEANHNVLESYSDKLQSNFLMIFCEEQPRVAARFDFLISHLEMENNKVLPLVVPEYSFHSLFDISYRLDWVSIMIAEEMGANYNEVPNIMNLKEFLNDLELIEHENQGEE